MSVPAFFLYFLCGVLFGVLLLLCIKLYLIRKSMKEICEELKEHLSMDTNCEGDVLRTDRWQLPENRILHSSDA